MQQQELEAFYMEKTAFKSKNQRNLIFPDPPFKQVPGPFCGGLHSKPAILVKYSIILVLKVFFDEQILIQILLQC